jgi:hypothetical protein
MKPIPFLLAVSAAVAGLGWSLFAQDAGRVSGKVLLLQNEHAFEGEVEKVGETYRVRKGTGEVSVPAAQVMQLCADWDDALAYMRARANLADPDERLRLAKWCHVNHLIEAARAEAKAALDLRPKHAETRQLVKQLELTATGKTAAKPAAPQPEPPPVPQSDVSFESVTAFTVRVQPILMNTCVNCHSTNHHGPFRLYRLHEGGERVATQRNLAAVLAQVNLEKPAASTLLAKALSAHGDAKNPPMPGKQAPTFQALCHWIDQTLADNPQLREKAGLPPVPPGPPPPAVVSQSVPRAEEKPAAKPALPPLPEVVPAQYTTPAPKTAAPPAPAPAVAAPLDEFDPVIFNRQAQPPKK